MSQAHQFSYTVPYAWIDGSDGGAGGIGDITLNYRYQAFSETNLLAAFAPRISLVIPMGNERRGRGDGSTGYQISLPVSKIVADRVTLHGNAGLTSLLNVEWHQPVSMRLSGSIIYAVTRDLNLILEAVHEWKNSVDDFGQLENSSLFTLAPGVRTALNLSNGQLVVGIAAPVEFSGSGRDYGVLFYGSFEHSFLAGQR